MNKQIEKKIVEGKSDSNRDASTKLKLPTFQIIIWEELKYLTSV